MKRPLNPNWLAFISFAILNSLIAFTTLSMTVKLWLGLILLILLIFLSFGSGSQKGTAPAEITWNIPIWLWILVLASALFVRFFRLTSLSTWPNLDEASFAFIAMRLAKHWDWRFFYGHSQNVFPFFWSLALWFKTLGPSLSTLWLYPALASTLAVPLAYLAAKQYFPKGHAFLLMVLFAFSYWALFEGRVTMFTALVPAAELLALYAFGRYLKEGQRTTSTSILLLAFTVALSFYTYPLAWTPLALFIVLSFLYRSKGKGLWPFLLTLTTLLAPLAYGVWRDYGSYLHAVAASEHRLLTSLSYITGIFWGKQSGDYYGPEWGGFLDPLTGALFFIGIGEGLRENKRSLLLWILAAAGLCLLPGMLSPTLEFNRILFVLPFLLAIAGSGLQTLTLELPFHSRTWILTIMMSVILSLNFYHLFGAYQQRWKTPGPSWETYKSSESFRAYLILEATSRKEGLGICFTNFGANLFDQALQVSTAPFNAAAQEALETIPHWYSVTTNENYRPFLDQRFFHGRWLSLSPGLDRVDGGQALGLFYVHEADLDSLQKWVKAEEAFQEVAYQFLNRPTGTDYKGIIEALRKVRPLVVGDPFLESCYWEKLYYLYLQNRAFGDKELSENLGGSLEALRSGLRYGYPAAHLYNELGTYLLMMGKKGEAKRAFQDSLKTNPNFKPAWENLELIR